VITPLKRLALFAAFASLAGLAPPASAAIPPEWSQPQAPFRVVGDIYYVGSKGLAAYLVVSPAGDVLLDGTLAENAPMVERNIKALGFHLRDVKVLLVTHAHYDHAGGLARLKADTGAVMMASAGDRWALEHGTSRGDNTADLRDYPTVRIDKVLRDNQVVRLGPIAMTAVLTPGHTPGCTSWTTSVMERGRRLVVAFPCSLSVAGNVLVGNRAYPDVVADYRRSLARVGSLKADVTLPAHPELADVLGREQRRRAGDAAAFVDPGQLPRLVAQAAQAFETELQAQKGATAAAR
jgi:metallo-beta-lactamase class B